MALCHQSFSQANTTGTVWGTDKLCPGVGGKTDVEVGAEAGAGTAGVTLVSSQSYSHPSATPQTSPRAAKPQLEQRRQLLHPHAQPGPENLAVIILQYAPLAANRGLQRSQFHPPF